MTVWTRFGLEQEIESEGGVGKDKLVGRDGPRGLRLAHLYRQQDHPPTAEPRVSERMRDLRQREVGSAVSASGCDVLGAGKSVQTQGMIRGLRVGRRLTVIPPV